MLGIRLVGHPRARLRLRKLTFQPRLHARVLCGRGLRLQPRSARLSELSLEISTRLTVDRDLLLRGNHVAPYLGQLPLRLRPGLSLSCDFILRGVHPRLRIRKLPGLSRDLFLRGVRPRLRIRKLPGLLRDLFLRGVHPRLRIRKLPGLLRDLFLRAVHPRLRIRDLRAELRMHPSISVQGGPRLLQFGGGLSQRRVEIRRAHARFGSGAGFHRDAAFECLHARGKLGRMRLLPPGGRLLRFTACRGRFRMLMRSSFFPLVSLERGIHGRGFLCQRRSREIEIDLGGRVALGRGRIGRA
jgi:hypothetical protein